MSVRNPNPISNNLTSDHDKQAELIIKTTQIIQDSLLYAYPYIDVSTAKILLNYSTAGTMKALRRMIKMGIVKEAEGRTKANRKMKIFSLTHSAIKNSEVKGLKHWNMAKFSIVKHTHNMNLHLICRDLRNFYKDKLGDVSFQQNYLINMPNVGEQIKRPDLAMEYGFNILPIEYERTLKSAIRYIDILKVCYDYYESYYNNKTAFMWIFENENIAQKFKVIVDSQDYTNKQILSAVDIFVWDKDGPPNQRFYSPYKIWGNPISDEPRLDFWQWKAAQDNEDDY